uniref:Uncharacterized protein n=1 Tax=Peronospora matthiolae TaxID=2874970 RepID=A0AAV1VNH0_9STRA
MREILCSKCGLRAWSNVSFCAVPVRSDRLVLKVIVLCAFLHVDNIDRGSSVHNETLAENVTTTITGALSSEAVKSCTRLLVQLANLQIFGLEMVGMNEKVSKTCSVGYCGRLEA